MPIVWKKVILDIIADMNNAPRNHRNIFKDYILGDNFVHANLVNGKELILTYCRGRPLNNFNSTILNRITIFEICKYDMNTSKFIYLNI